MSGLVSHLFQIRGAWLDLISLFSVDYVAPESILGLGGDDAAVDWVRRCLTFLLASCPLLTGVGPLPLGQWALGVVMYELLYGIPPFNDETAEKVFDNIISRRIHWPDPEDDDVSPEARDLMEKLMCTDPARRLGAGGAEEIRQHPFFDGIDWDTVATAPASFVPQVSDEVSTDYFDARGLLELPDELDPTSAVPDPREDQTGTSSHDDFGTFNFRNLSASKAANDQVVQDMRELLLGHCCVFVRR